MQTNPQRLAVSGGNTKLVWPQGGGLAGGPGHAGHAGVPSAATGRPTAPFSTGLGGASDDRVSEYASVAHLALMAKQCADRDWLKHLYLFANPLKDNLSRM